MADDKEKKDVVNGEKGLNGGKATEAIDNGNGLRGYKAIGSTIGDNFKVENRPTTDGQRTMKIGSYEDMASQAIEARNRTVKEDDEKEEKRLKARKIIGTVSGVLGGLGNLIAANAGARPVEQSTELLDDTKKAYAELLDRKRKRAQEDLDELYSARAKDIKDARAERLSKEGKLEKYDAQMRVEAARKANKIELERIKAENAYNLEMYKQTGKMEYLEALNKGKKELENIRQTRLDARTREREENINARTDASNKSRYGDAVSVESQKPKKETSQVTKKRNKNNAFD